jgi:hypothetical protein
MFFVCVCFVNGELKYLWNNLILKGRKGKPKSSQKKMNPSYLIQSAAFLLDLSPISAVEQQNVKEALAAGFNKVLLDVEYNPKFQIMNGTPNPGFTVYTTDISITLPVPTNSEKQCTFVITNAKNLQLDVGILVNAISKGAIVQIPIQIAHYVGKPMSLIQLQVYLRRKYLDIRCSWIMWVSMLVFLFVLILGFVFNANSDAMWYTFISLAIITGLSIAGLSIPTEISVISKERDKFNNIPLIHTTAFSSDGTQTTSTTDPARTSGGVISN